MDIKEMVKGILGFFLINVITLGVLMGILKIFEM